MAELLQPSPLVDFIAGTAGGIVSLLVGHPFDTIKTRLQTQPHSLAASSDIACPPSSSRLSTSTSKIPAAGLQESRPLLNVAFSNHVKKAATCSVTLSSVTQQALLHQRPDGNVPVYRSAIHAFQVIVKEEKFVGLYKGVTSPMLGVAVMNASIFGLYSLALQFQQHHGLFTSQPSPPSSHTGSFRSNLEPTLTQIMVAGMISGISSSFITAPIDLIKIRQQMDLSCSIRQGSLVPPRPSTFQVFLHVLQNEGLFRGVFRGWGCTAIRDLGYGPYFWSYELINRWIASHGSSSSSAAGGVGRMRPLTNTELAISGGIAGVLAWLSTFWADVIKTKVQASSHLDDASRLAAAGHPTAFKPWWYHSLFVRTVVDTYKDGGWRAFSAGVGPTVLRAIPVNSVLFVVFEVVKDALTSYGL